MKYYTELEAKLIVKKSDRCFNCDRLMKVYKYKILRSMIHALALFYKHTIKTGNEWVHLDKFFDKYPTPLVRHWEYLQYWGLIFPSPLKAMDGNPSGIGRYKITKKAKAFLKGYIRIPKFCLHYHREVIGFSDMYIGVNDSYKGIFEFDKFMEGE